MTNWNLQRAGQHLRGTRRPARLAATEHRFLVTDYWPPRPSPLVPHHSMSWVTILSSMIASVSFTLATIYLLIWCQRRTAWANLLFSLTAAATTLVAAAAEAGTNDLAFVVKSWRTIDGLPQNSVNAMAQTPDGYLWVGTRGGLARFDGVRFAHTAWPMG